MKEGRACPRKRGRFALSAYLVHQVSDEEFQRELPRYCEIVGLPTDGKTFAKDLRDKLNAALDETDANFPANDSIEFVDEELVIHKPGKEPEPPECRVVGLNSVVSFEPGADRLIVIIDPEHAHPLWCAESAARAVDLMRHSDVSHGTTGSGVATTNSARARSVSAG